MLTFIQFLEELSKDSVTLSPAEVEHMRNRFGDKVLRMGHLDEDGSMSEVDPIVWTKFRQFLDGGAGCPGGGPKAAIHSGLESALGSHPCVALSSYQASPLYGDR